jgi:hypothetical protein
MTRIIVIAIATVLFGCAGMSPASRQGQPVQTDDQAPPIAGKARLGVTVLEMEAIFVGWSVKKDLLGKTVMNEMGEAIGKIDDLVITPDNAVSYAIIGVGGFLGIGKHDVVIPVDHLELRNGQMVLPGATREVLRKLPPFEYARK